MHVVAGTAQIAGQLYNASRDGSAIVMTAGLNDNAVWSDEAGLAPRPGFSQKKINRQFTKISWEARKPESLALMTRRAFKVACTEPGGPVYLAMAGYALEAKGVSSQVLPAERFLLRGRVRVDEASVQEAARLLLESKRPVFVVGDEVWKSGAQDEFVAFAEMLGVGVTLTVQGFQNFPAHHPQNMGRFQMGSEYVQQGVDLIVCVGSRDFGGRSIPEDPEVPATARIVRIGIDTSSMSRNYPTDVALVADVREALVDLRAAIESAITKTKMAEVAESRSLEVRHVVAKDRAKSEAEARQNFGKSPIHPDELGHALARKIDPYAIVVSENLTGKYGSFPFGHRPGEPMWLSNTGFSLGWGSARRPVPSSAHRIDMSSVR